MKNGDDSWWRRSLSSSAEEQCGQGVSERQRLPPAGCDHCWAAAEDSGPGEGDVPDYCCEVTEEEEEERVVLC